MILQELLITKKTQCQSLETTIYIDIDETTVCQLYTDDIAHGTVNPPIKAQQLKIFRLHPVIDLLVIGGGSLYA